MEHTPFSLEQANDIAEDFEDLIDTDFSISNAVDYLIDNVVVCPFNDADKKLFATNYHHTKEKASSLNFYTGTEFDVIVFAYDMDNAAYTYIDIRTFVEHKGITYRFPETTLQ
jgi:hypothetical protein